MPTNPNPFSPTERAFIRDMMCIPLLNTSANSEMENVMSTIDALYSNSADQGATQARIRAYMAEVIAVDTKIDNNSSLMLATEVTDEVKFDAIRNMEGLRDYGRQLVGRISRQIGMLPRDDYFAGAPIAEPDGDYLNRSNYEHIVTSFTGAMGKYSRHKR
jgi:hypothetical protein